MNITYLIGNGFDIGLGLNTRYCDFIPYLKDELNSVLNLSRTDVKERERKVASWILKAIETHKQEFWSDAEIAFGGLSFVDLANQIGGTIDPSATTLDEAPQNLLPELAQSFVHGVRPQRSPSNYR